MDRNLYAPPAASVADPVETRGGHRPWQVTWAVNLIWLWVPLSVANIVVAQFVPTINAPSYLPIAIVSTVLSPAGIQALAVAWLNSQIAHGRNWARIVLTVIFALGLVYLAFQWRLYAKIFAAINWQTFATTSPRILWAASWAGAVLRSLLNLSPALLFTPKANQWFKAMR
jgi:hypothetical protein